MYNDLKRTSYDEGWGKEQLKSHNISDLEEIFYSGLNAGILYVSKKH